MKKRFFIIVSLLLAVTQLAQVCGGPSNGPAPDEVEIVIWKTFDDQADMQVLFDAYQAQNPNVRFTYTRKDIATYEDELLEALATGNGPDIFTIHNDWLPRYQNKMLPAPEGLFSAREFQESFIDVASDELVDLNGGIFAVPLYVDTLALYYNKDLLGSAGIATPPRTWAEVVDAVKKLTRQDRFGNFLINGIALGTSDNINRATDILSLLMLQNGTQFYNSARTTAALNRTVTAQDGSQYNPGAQALEFYTQFANPAKETYTWNAKNNHSIDSFVAGQTAMMLSYSYLLPTLESKAPLLNFGVAPVPQIDLTKPKVNFANYFAEGVSKASDNPDWAWDFLKFATNEEPLRSFYAVNKQPSSRKDIISTQISDPQIGVFAEGALTAKTFYKPDSARIEAALEDMIGDVILRGMTPSKAVDNGNQLFNNLLR